MQANPTRRARTPAAPPPDPQPPTPDEAARLLSESWRLGFGPFVWLAMTTGARRDELCALRWGNLQVNHAERGVHECLAAGCRWQLVIRRGIGEGHDGQLWETDTKTHQRRHVALDPESVAILADHRQRCEQDAAQLGATLTDEHFIFSATPDGTAPVKRGWPRPPPHPGVHGPVRRCPVHQVPAVALSSSNQSYRPATSAVDLAGRAYLRR